MSAAAAAARRRRAAADQSAAVAASSGKACATVCASIPGVLLAIYMLDVYGEVSDLPSCLAPYQVPERLTVDTGSWNELASEMASEMMVSEMASGGPTFTESEAEQVDANWRDLLHDLELYGTFQLIQAVLAVSVACGMVGVLAGQELLCGCVVSLASVGACCMLIPNLVVLVLLLVSWSEVGDACDGNKPYEKVDFVVTIIIIVFIINCAIGCANMRNHGNKEQAYTNP